MKTGGGQRSRSAILAIFSTSAPFNFERSPLSESSHASLRVIFRGRRKKDSFPKKRGDHIFGFQTLVVERGLVGVNVDARWVLDDNACAVMTLVMQRLCLTALYFASICIVVELR